MTIRIFDICRNGTRVLGPGNRYAIWVQGCEQNCYRCITPESRPKNGGHELDVDDLAADIIINKNIDGITISGGEPFLQPVALCSLLDQVKKIRPQLTVIIYTGLVYENLLKIPVCLNLIEKSDIIIDGQYVESLNDNKGIRGSSNQRINPITNRLDNYINIMESCNRKLQRIADTNGLITTIGIPDKKKYKIKI